ncbi:hypothetical protein CLU96_3055 [Chryseobacterium sp. 52]|uniref:hypothetical protein n=1 Tax=Chryseobacterium sp. 52 TaxID=2035213 RepID=UPI000C17821A|nr:hypothetical protein [Chryseobacterium sp. 52]PIF46037.1 hypothetical protein CLU96_3055 [Chryseobacterium sp. 52]
MKNKIILFIISFFCFLASCYSQKNIKEFVQLNHENVMVIKGDKLKITLIPTTNNRKRSVVVKTFRNNEQYDNKRITIAEYNKIIELIMQTEQKDIDPSLGANRRFQVAVIDGGTNSITLKRDTLEKKLYTSGISKEYHNQFYEATELILKAAKLEINDLD